MPETWPGTLPTKFLVDAYQEGFAENRLRSDMDRGPAKVRRLSTTAPRPLSGAMAMTTTELAALRTFFDSTTAMGSLSFWFPSQVDNGPMLLCRFGENPPSWTYMSLDLWRIELELEVLP